MGSMSSDARWYLASLGCVSSMSVDLRVKISYGRRRLELCPQGVIAKEDLEEAANRRQGDGPASPLV